jgi:hypothetical protein
MSLLELFCDVDDFMLSFAAQWRASQWAAGKQRERASQLCPSEAMTILIHFHQSHYRTWKRVLHRTCSGASKPRISSSSQLCSLCRSHSRHAGSAPGLLADPIWTLHRHQFYGFKLHLAVNDCGDLRLSRTHVKRSRFQL